MCVERVKARHRLSPMLELTNRSAHTHGPRTFMLDITKSQIRKCDRAALLRLAKVLGIQKPELLPFHVLPLKVRDYMQVQSGPRPVKSPVP